MVELRMNANNFMEHYNDYCGCMLKPLDGTTQLFAVLEAKFLSEHDELDKFTTS